MRILSHLRTAAILTFAVVAPFATVWTVSVLAHRFTSRPVDPKSVALFSDHITEPAKGLPPFLPAFRQLWADRSAKSLQDLVLLDDQVVIASRSKLYRIEPKSGAVLEEVSPPILLRPISDLSLADAPHTLSVYSFDNGAFALAELSGRLAIHRPVLLQTALGQPHALGDRVVANGAFPAELMHAYSMDENAPTLADTAAFPTQRAGEPLFAGLRPAFSRQLNVTSLAVSSSRDRLVLAFRWSDRVNIYEASNLRLERSIAGPQESRLSFGTADYDGELIFALDAEATHSYADVTAGPCAIVALYSGLEKRKHRATMGLGSRLHVFDWTGRLIGQWQLSAPVLRLAIDWKTQTLYALRAWPEPGLLAADFSAVSKAIDVGCARDEPLVPGSASSRAAR